MNPTSLLGPNKAAERLEQLQSRIDAFSPRPIPPSPSFGSALSGAIGNPSPADPSQMQLTPDSAFTSQAVEAATQNGIDPAIFKSLVNAESSWNPQSVSGRGAIGLTQLMPDTAKELGVTDPYDPVQNLQGGAKYLRQMLDKFGGDYPKALAAYNAGPTAVEKANGMPPYQETISYVSQILKHAASNP